MAGRSDFTSDLPRTIKRSVIMGLAHGFIKDVHQAADIRSAFVDAHRSHRAFKTNRKYAPTEDVATDTDKE